MSYHYYIATTGSPLTSWTEIFLSNEIETTKKYYEDEKFSREEVNDFKIQKSLNSAFCATLESWFADPTKFSNEIGVEVYRGLRADGDQYFKGFFSVSDVTYEKEKAYFEFTPRIDDDYRELLQGESIEYDIKGILTGLDIIYAINTDFVPTTWRSDGTKEYHAYDTFNSTGSLINTAIDASAAYVCECYNSIYRFTATGAIWIIEITDYNKLSGSNPYIDICDYDGGPNISLTDGAKEITGNGYYCFRILDTQHSADLPFITIFTSTIAGHQSSFTLDLSYRKSPGYIYNGIKWIDFLEFFVTDSDFMNLSGFSGKVKSTFLNCDSVPTAGPSTINTWMASYPAGNYAYLNTGSNPLTSFVISETCGWINSDTNDFKISFSDIMNDIRNTLQAWWYIDESGNLRIEHLSWFEYLFTDSTGVVLTSATYQKYRPLSDSQKLTFNKSQLSSREQFKWPQYESIWNGGILNFPGVDIIYNELESIDNVTKHEISRVTTDVKYLIDNPDDASGDGYLFLHCLGKCTYFDIQYEDSIYGLGGYRLNNHFGWSSLHPRYWTWGRMSQNGSMNGAATTFNSAVRFLEQTVKFGHQSTLDIFERIITPQGNGFQLETKRNLDTDFLTIKLGYDPYA